MSDCCKSETQDCGCEDQKRINIVINNSADSGYRESSNPYSRTDNVTKNALNVPPALAAEAAQITSGRIQAPAADRYTVSRPVASTTAGRTCRNYTIIPEWA